MRRKKNNTILFEEEGLIKASTLLKNQNEFNSYKINIPNKEEIEEIIDYLEIDPNNLYYFYSDLICFFYYIEEENFIYIRLELGLEVMKFIKTKKRLNKIIEYSKEAFENGHYIKTISLVEKKYQIEAFLRLFDLYKNNEITIKDEDMFEIFEWVYTTSEFGFNKFSKSDTSTLLSLNTNDGYKSKIDKDINGYVTIYRGEGGESSPLDKAYSWTLDKDKAEWFADRFDIENVGLVYRGKVHIDNIKAYFEDRGEEEVIVSPEDVVDVQVVLDKSCC